ncbi:MAG: hypothetical protein IPM52_02270 [Bacteroidetes bacterium]|nr:hypothetical protein [Bacteroidota bacterium]
MKLIMAFAMFWLFIGDLIVLHQERIFGHDFFGHHQPLNKPGKSDDGKTFQKFHKSSDKGDDGHAYAVLTIRSTSGLDVLGWNRMEFAEFRPEVTRFFYLSGKGLRAPPALA